HRPLHEKCRFSSIEEFHLLPVRLQPSQLRVRPSIGLQKLPRHAGGNVGYGDSDQMADDYGFRLIDAHKRGRAFQVCPRLGVLSVVKRRDCGIRWQKLGLLQPREVWKGSSKSLGVIELEK